MRTLVDDFTNGLPAFSGFWLVFGFNTLSIIFAIVALRPSLPLPTLRSNLTANSSGMLMLIIRLSPTLCFDIVSG